MWVGIKQTFAVGLLLANSVRLIFGAGDLVLWNVEVRP